MTKRKGLLLLFGGLFALLLVLGGTAAIAQAIDLMDTPIGDAEALAYQGEGDADSPDEDGEGDGDSAGHHGYGEGYGDSAGHHGYGEGGAHSPEHHGFGKGKHGFGEHLEGITPMDELLAAELGISVEALHDALAETHAAAREQAEEDGYSHDGRFHGKHHGYGEEHLALLAEKLGKSVDELQAAQAAAKAALLVELVDAGIVTQEQIDMMEAKRALGETINPEALLAEALGMEIAELEAAREAGASLRELLGETSVEDFVAAYKAAYEAAVLQAAADGVITDAQAEEILNGGFGFGRSHGFGKGGSFGPGHEFGHGDGQGGHHFGGPGGSRGFGPGQSSPQTTGISL